MKKIFHRELVKTPEEYTFNRIPAPRDDAREILQYLSINNSYLKLVTENPPLITQIWLQKHNLDKFIDEIIYYSAGRN